MRKTVTMKLIYLKILFLFFRNENAFICSLNRIITKSGAKKIPAIYEVICFIRDTRANVLRNLKLAVARYSGMATLKMMRDLDQVSELYSIFETLGINYFLVGGVAYDARLNHGQAIWLHDDIDIAILSGNTKVLCKMLSSTGWHIISQGVNIKIKKEQTFVDVFLWKSENNMAIKDVGNIELKIPINHFSYDLMLLHGKTHRVASVEYIARIKPIVGKGISKKSITKILQAHNSVPSERAQQ